MGVTKTDGENTQNYHCKNCDYTTSHRGHWNMHIETKKHKMLSIAYINRKMTVSLTTPYSEYACHCGKSYSSMPSLSRHRKTCSVLKKWKDEVMLGKFDEDSSKTLHASASKETKKNEKDTINGLGDGLHSPNTHIVLDKKTFELMEENTKLKDTVIAALKDKPIIVSTGDNAVINANHNTVNINVFLNQNYTEAMNLEDFIRNIKCSIDDLTLTANEGYVKGVSNIFLRNLEYMDPKERPIHCGDQHGTQIYIRDSDKWEKDGGKLDHEIDNVAKKQIMLMSQWEQIHPNWHKDERLTHEYLNLVRQLTSHDKENGNEQIRKTVAKNVLLDEIMNIE